MACYGRGLNARLPFADGVLTPSQRYMAKRRYAECVANGSHFHEIRIWDPQYREAFSRSTPYGVWVALIEKVWDDICDREGRPEYSFREARRRGVLNIIPELCELAWDFHDRNRLLVWVQFVNACLPFSKTAETMLLKQVAMGGDGEYLRCGIPNREGRLHPFGPGAPNRIYVRPRPGRKNRNGLGPPRLSYAPPPKPPTFIERVFAWAKTKAKSWLG